MNAREPEASGPTFLRFDGMTWPNPERLGDIAWNLRYGTPTRHDQMVAASVINAYLQLVYDPQTTRNQKVAGIRKAINPPGVSP